MKTFWILGACLGLVASTTAFAQQVMSSEEIKALIAGKTIDLGSAGRATYKADGKYEYWYEGQTFRGNWAVQDNRVCVNFVDGRSRCDQYLKDGSKFVLKNSRGTSFPVLSVK